MFDASGSDGDFGYTWTEFAVRVRNWVRLGLSAQRTREHRGARWIDRGVFGAVSKGPVELSFHRFNVDASPERRRFTELRQPSPLSIS